MSNKKHVKFANLPEGVEVDTNDDVEEVEAPDLTELEAFLHESGREFERSDDYDDEDEIGGDS